jgi:hypothetical protein
MRSVSSDIASIARESSLSICNNVQPELTTIGAQLSIEELVDKSHKKRDFSTYNNSN